MFSYVRLILGFILLACVILAKRFWGIPRSNAGRTVIAVCLILGTTLSFFLPFESCFISFKSAESAYRYVCSDKKSIDLIVEGSETDFVIGSEDGTYTYLIVPKLTDTWKLGLLADTRKINQIVTDNVVIYVYQYKHTNDYYITVLNTSGGPATISDTCNSEFFHVSQYNEVLSKNYYTYFAYINNISDQYVITVNEKTITLE